MPTIGVPTAAAMCVGPVSPDTITRRAARQRDEIGDRRLRRQHRRAVRAPRRPRRRASRSPGPHSTTDISPCRSRSAAATRAEPRRRPALVRPRRAGIEQRVAAAGLLARPSAPPPNRPCSIGNSGAAARDAERLEQPEVDLDDMPRLARIVDARRRRDRRPRCRTAAPAARAA